jgi:hypothetical protein
LATDALSGSCGDQRDAAKPAFQPHITLMAVESERVMSWTYALQRLLDAAMTALVSSPIYMYAEYARIGYAGYPVGDVREK